MIRVALIGCGAVAESGHLPALLRHQRFEVAATCDTRSDRASLPAGLAGGAASYRDWRGLLERQAVDAAVLALPPEVSPDVAIECVRRGLPVLDEKPLATTAAEGRRIVRVVEEHGGVHQVEFGLRYGDWVREVGRLAGLIGSPMRIRVAVFDERLDRSDAAHFDRIQGFLRTSSAMAHEGSHVIDYAALWNPSPWTRVRASAERIGSFLDGPNLWHAEIELADGSALEIDLGWLLPELPPCGVSLLGPNGEAELNPVTGLGHWRVGESLGVLNLPPLAPEWDCLYDAFARATDRGVAEEATIEDGMRALEVTAACETSARTASAVVRRDAHPTLDR